MWVSNVCLEIVIKDKVVMNEININRCIERRGGGFCFVHVQLICFSRQTIAQVHVFTSKIDYHNDIKYSKLCWLLYSCFSGH